MPIRRLLFRAITAAGVASYVSRTLLGVPSTTRKGSKGLAAVATNWKLFDVGPLTSVAQDVVIASFVAAVFAKALRTSADLFKKVPAVNDSLDAARAAAITGAITLAVGSPMILFWHSAPFKAALAGSLSRNRVLTLAAAKVAATGACVSSPLVGGLFAPTLILGALGGAAVSPTVARYAAAACLGAFFGTPVTGRAAGRGTAEGAGAGAAFVGRRGPRAGAAEVVGVSPFFELRLLPPPPLPSWPDVRSW